MLLLLNFPRGVLSIFFAFIADFRPYFFKVLQILVPSSPARTLCPIIQVRLTYSLVNGDQTNLVLS